MSKFKAYEVKEERTWLPTMPETVYASSGTGSYLHSIIAGVLSPVLHLPFHVWKLCLKPFLMGIWAVIAFTCLAILLGLLGRVSGVRREVKEREPTADEKEMAMRHFMSGSGFVPVPLHREGAFKEEEKGDGNP